MILSNLYSLLTLASPDLKGKKTAFLSYGYDTLDCRVRGWPHWEGRVTVLKVARDNARTVYGV
jgi:hypothetical protein